MTSKQERKIELNKRQPKQQPAYRMKRSLNRPICCRCGKERWSSRCPCQSCEEYKNPWSMDEYREWMEEVWGPLACWAEKEEKQENLEK